MTAHDPGVTLPNWPALLDDQLAAAYCTMSEATFIALARLKGVRPVDTGFRLKRWRRRDLDVLVDSLPAKGLDPTSRGEAAPVDSAEEGLRRVAALGDRPRAKG